MLCLLILLFVIQNAIHQRVMKCTVQKWHSSVAMEFKNATEIEFHGFGN